MKDCLKSIYIANPNGNYWRTKISANSYHKANFLGKVTKCFSSLAPVVAQDSTPHEIYLHYVAVPTNYLNTSLYYHRCAEENKRQEDTPHEEIDDDVSDFTHYIRHFLLKLFTLRGGDNLNIQADTFLQDYLFKTILRLTKDASRFSRNKSRFNCSLFQYFYLIFLLVKSALISYTH